MRALVLFVVLLVHMMDSAIVNIALWDVSAHLGVELDQGQWLISSFNIGFICALPLVPRWTQGGDTGRHFRHALLVSLAALALCGLGGTLAMVSLGRFLHGMATAGIVLLAGPLLTEALRGRPPALSASLWLSAFFIAPVFGPIVGALVVEHQGWRWIFLGQLPLLLAALLTVPGGSTGGAPPLQLPGRVLLLGGLLLLTQRLSQDMLEGKSLAPQGVWPLALTLVSTLAALVWRERRAAQGLFDWRLVSDPSYAPYLLLVSLQSGVAIAMTAIYTLWMTQTLGLSLWVTACVLGVSGVLSGLLSPLVTSLVPAARHRQVVIAGAAVMVLSCLAGTRLDLQADAWALTLPRLLWGVGLGLTGPSNHLMVEGLAPERRLAGNSLALFGRMLAGNLLLVLGLGVFECLRERLFDQQVANGWGTPLGAARPEDASADLAALLSSLCGTQALTLCFAICAAVLGFALLVLLAGGRAGGHENAPRGSWGQAERADGPVSR